MNPTESVWHNCRVYSVLGSILVSLSQSVSHRVPRSSQFNTQWRVWQLHRQVSRPARKDVSWASVWDTLLMRWLTGTFSSLLARLTVISRSRSPSPPSRCAENIVLKYFVVMCHIKVLQFLTYCHCRLFVFSRYFKRTLKTLSSADKVYNAFLPSCPRAGPTNFNTQKDHIIRPGLAWGQHLFIHTSERGLR